MTRPYVISARVSDKVNTKVESAAKEQNASPSKVIGDILEEYFNEGWEKTLLESNLSTICRLERQVKQVLGDNEALFDFMSLFVFQWCCHLPELSNNQKQVQSIDGQKRYDEFLSVLKKIRIERKSFGALFLEEFRKLYVKVS